MIELSRYFKWEDVTRSDTADRLGINNSLPIEFKETAVIVANNMDVVRDFLGTPILINSWYRCYPLNTVLHSKDTSQHPLCQAVDWISPRFGNPAGICRAIVGNPLIKFDQLILEHGWIHISFQTIPTKPRRGQVLTLLKDGTYASGLVIQ